MCFISDDYPTLYETTTRTARTPKKCCECGKEIAPGDRYVDVRGVWDGEFTVFPTCRRCEFLRHEIYKRERAEGCYESESWCPHGGLHMALCDGEYDLDFDCEVPAGFLEKQT